MKTEHPVVRKVSSELASPGNSRNLYSKIGIGPSHGHVSAAYELEAACSMWVLGLSYDW